MPSIITNGTSWQGDDDGAMVEHAGLKWSSRRPVGPSEVSDVWPNRYYGHVISSLSIPSPLLSITPTASTARAMSTHYGEFTVRPEPDKILQDIADYVRDYQIDSESDFGPCMGDGAPVLSLFLSLCILDLEPPIEEITEYRTKSGRDTLE